MSHHPLDNSHGQPNFLYYILWAVLWSFSKIAGVWAWISSGIPTEIVLPEHHNKYLPELIEIIPPVIVTLICSLIAFIFNKLFLLAWNKIFNK